MIERIINEAKALGACDKTTGINTFAGLVELFFSPQGREFCQKNTFPDMSVWEGIKNQFPGAEPQGLYINAGHVHVHDKENVAIVGQSSATLHFSRPERAHRVVVMHGAKATIVARDYAVVNVTAIGPDCEVIIDKDETSVVL